jgi:hypothetical protein
MLQRKENRVKDLEIMDLSSVPTTEIEITEQQVQMAIDSMFHAYKSARYAKWLKGQVEELISRKPAVEPDPASPPPNPVLVMVCMLIAHAKDHPGGNFHRICLKRSLLDSLGDGYVPGGTN